MRPHKPNKTLIVLFAAFLALGLFSVFDASSVKGEISYNDPAFYLKRQLIWFVAGVAAFFVAYTVHHSFWKKLSLLIIIGGFGLMLLVFAPGIGLSLKGATRWIHIGPVSLQPAEFFKLALIMYLASFFSKHQMRLNNFAETTVPFLVIMGAATGILAAQRSLGVLIIVAFIALVIYFLSGVPIRYIFITSFICVGLFALLILVEPYRMQRIMTFLNPAQDTLGSGYQINQALISIGSGGKWGVGLGHSRQKFSFLPETMGDSIFALWAEETGFVGSTGLLMMLGLFVWRGLHIARQSKDLYAKLLASGITCWIGGQFLFNIAAISGLVPLSGIPLPFFSYGGSALISVMAAYGILLNLSRYTVKRA
ncbi:MAG: putative lipid II flippase FtsW [Parcubacteria group bacterium CG1_02_44_31]|nr:MAG: putative lipid II flippase FtsW [Parcubacteria group bacterium CG1_02_44_31]